MSRYTEVSGVRIIEMLDGSDINTPAFKYWLVLGYVQGYCYAAKFNIDTPKEDINVMLHNNEVEFFPYNEALGKFCERSGCP